MHEGEGEDGREEGRATFAVEVDSVGQAAAVAKSATDGGDATVHAKKADRLGRLRMVVVGSGRGEDGPQDAQVGQVEEDQRSLAALVVVGYQHSRARKYCGRLAEVGRQMRHYRRRLCRDGLAAVYRRPEQARRLSRKHRVSDAAGRSVLVPEAVQS